MKQRARLAGVPVVYVNDNFGKWRSDFREVLEHCLRSPGKEIAALLGPQREDYFVLKPKHRARRLRLLAPQGLSCW